MAGQMPMVGNQGGPTPWWQLPRGGSRGNLEQSAPGGYEYDPVQMGYKRTVASRTNDQLTRMQTLMRGLDGGDGGDGGAGGGGGGVGGGDGGSGNPPSQIASIAPPDSTAATNAAFASAKDQAGMLSRASLTSLNDELGASGMVGSGAQVQGTRDIIQSGAGQVGQVSRDLAGKQADQAADFAKTSYQGSITQRGQDIAAQEARARLAAEERRRRQDLLMRVMGGLGGGGTDEPVY